MQIHNQDPAASDAVERCRRKCAVAILGGDDGQDVVPLVVSRLVDAQFSPPELWQQAIDAIVQGETEHPRFEQFVLSLAIDEFSRQYFLLTRIAREERFEALLFAARPFRQLTWRLERLRNALVFHRDLLGQLETDDHRVAITLCRLYCLPPDSAARETRREFHRICQSASLTNQFLNSAVAIKRVPGMTGVIEKTGLLEKIRSRAYQSKTTMREPRIQRQLNRTEAGVSNNSWGAMNALFMLLTVGFVVVLLAQTGSQGPEPAPNYLQSKDLFSTQAEQKNAPSHVSSRFGDNQTELPQPPGSQAADLLQNLLEEDNSTQQGTHAWILEQRLRAMPHSPEFLRMKRRLEQQRKQAGLSIQQSETENSENRWLQRKPSDRFQSTGTHEIFEKQPSRPDGVWERMHLAPLSDVHKEYESNEEFRSLFSTPAVPQSERPSQLPASAIPPWPAASKLPSSESSFFPPGQRQFD